jgi:hypothetical protein
VTGTYQEAARDERSGNEHRERKKKKTTTRTVILTEAVTSSNPGNEGTAIH